MKRLLSAIFFICAAAFCVAASESLLSSKPSGAINDYAGVLGAHARATLEQFCTSLHRKTGVSIVVATTRSLDGGSIDDIGNRLYERWGIGKKGVDEGVLLLIAVEDRKIRIETGYGSEGYITDAHASSIIRTITAPYLKQGQWDDGVSATVVALAQLAADEKGISLEEIAGGQRMHAQRRAPRARQRSPLSGLFLIIIIVFLLATPMGRAMLPWLLLASLGSSRRSYGGGFGGGFGGGGFGGFGGGMSGGGGASGSF